MNPKNVNGFRRICDEGAHVAMNDETSPAGTPDRDDEHTPASSSDESSAEYGLESKPKDTAEAEADAARSDDPAPNDLDVCPNCTAPMPNPDQLVCMRCGFDLRGMRVIETESTVEDVDPEPPSRREDDILRSGIPDSWLPPTLTIVPVIILLAFALGGWPGLFPAFEAAQEAIGDGLNESARERWTLPAVPWTERGLAVLQLILGFIVWIGCATVGVLITAPLMGFGAADLRHVVQRVMAMVACAHLVLLLDLPRIAETVIELLLGLVLFTLLALLFFRMKPRDAGTLTGITLSLYVALFVGARVLVWMTGG